jgi:hypothetical protein
MRFIEFLGKWRGGEELKRIVVVQVQVHGSENDDVDAKFSHSGFTFARATMFVANLPSYTFQRQVYAHAACVRTVGTVQTVVNCVP